MTVLELMERAGIENETLAIAYIKDALHLIQSNTKEKIKVSKQDVLNSVDSDDNVESELVGPTNVECFTTINLNDEVTTIVAVKTSSNGGDDDE